MRRAIRAIAVAALLAAALAASPARASSWFVGVEVGDFDPSGFSDAYDAVYGGGLTPVGLRVEWSAERWFAVLSAARMETEGERVVLVPQPVGTGVASRLELEPVRLSVAYRFRPGRAWRPYAGGGISTLGIREETRFDDFSDRTQGLHVLGGISWRRRALRAGAELVVSTIDSGDAGGLLEPFGEDDLGGRTLSLYLGWSF